METLLGSGVLNWFRNERVSNRYGTVYLEDGVTGNIVDLHKTSPKTGPRTKVKGKLIAEVVESRKSNHIGDLFRKISPRMTSAGTRIVLGEGFLYKEAEQENGKIYYKIGVSPLDQRENNWMDIRALYDIHEHVVKLFWIEDNK